MPAHPGGGPALQPAGDQHRHEGVLCPGLSGEAAHLLPERGHRAPGAGPAGEYIQASHAFLPIEDTDRAENIRRLPGGKCAAIYHVGDYQSIGRSYRRLLDYCQGQGLAIRSGSFEFCINDYITTEDESEYITKIQFYVGRE